MAGLGRAHRDAPLRELDSRRRLPLQSAELQDTEEEQMSEYRQGKERGKIILSGAALLAVAVVCAILVIRPQPKGFMDVVLGLGALVALYFVYRQVVDYLSDPVVKVDATGMTVTGYFPKSQNFSFTWAEAGTAFARATAGSGGTVTFMAKDDASRVLGVIHGYSRFVNLPELRDKIKEYMGVSPSYA
jgi:hypothetical protein